MKPRVRLTMHALALAGVSLTLWYAAAAQRNGAAYLLCFMVVALGLVSWLHARANLRGLQLRVGAMPAATAGAVTHLPLVLEVKEGRAPWGIELSGPDVVEPQLVEHVPVGSPVRVSLPMRAKERGVATTIRVVARSLYPLGLFRCSRVIEVPTAQLVLPQPAGDLPLPKPSHEKHDATASSGAPTTGEGDDFAGVREWQPGDSLKRVDWKAVARGREPMVKLWASGASSVVWLDWRALDLADEARVGQLAQWVNQAEQQGLAYGLRLPKEEIAPDRGPDHQRRCLEKLAVTGNEGTSALPSTQASESRRRITASTLETRTELPRGTLPWMLTALLCASLPPMSVVPISGPLVFLFALAMRAYLGWTGRWWAPQWFKLVLITLGAMGTIRNLIDLRSVEIQTGFLLSVTAGKVLEARTPRDLQVLAAIAMLFGMCSLAIEQSMGQTLYVVLVFLGIITALVRLRRASQGIAAPVRTTFVLLAQALPLIIALFLFFPRDTGELVARMSRASMVQSGLSDQINAGSVSELAKSQEPAFRVTLINRSLSELKPADRYWRCHVLWQGQGFQWRAAGPTSQIPVAPLRPGGGIVHKVQLLGHGGLWLPALETPSMVMSSNDRSYFKRRDVDVLSASQPVNALTEYTVRSDLNPVFLGMPQSHLLFARQKWKGLSARANELAQSFVDEKYRDVEERSTEMVEDIVGRAMRHFRDNEFSYTLEPGEYAPGSAGMDDFLFVRRKGFCEHYATAFATLMRAVGVPARVVTGYQGGQHVSSGDYLLIRQSDAHAWVEVFSPKGWQRVDPVTALAPDRVNMDLQTTLAGGAESAFAIDRNGFLGRMVLEGQMLWDHANYLWYERVVQFDTLAQDDFFKWLGMFKMSRTSVLLLVLSVFGLPLLLLWWWISRNARHPDPHARRWLAFCRSLAREGAVRGDNEGPLDFAERAVKLIPAKAETIRETASSYVASRYGTA